MPAKRSEKSSGGGGGGGGSAQERTLSSGNSVTYSSQSVIDRMYIPTDTDSKLFNLSTSFDNLAAFIKTCMQVVNCTMDGLDHYLEVHGIIKLWLQLYQNYDRAFVKRLFFPHGSLDAFPTAYQMYTKIIDWVTKGCVEPLRLRELEIKNSESAVLHYFVATSATFKSNADTSPPTFDQSICFNPDYLKYTRHAVYNPAIPENCDVTKTYEIQPAFLSCNMVRIVVNKETKKYNLSYAAPNNTLEKLMETKDGAYNSSAITSAIQSDIDAYGRPDPTIDSDYTPYVNISAVVDITPGTSSRIQTDLPLTSDFQLPITRIINQSLGLVDAKLEVDIATANESGYANRRNLVLEAVKYSQSLPTNVRPSYFQQFQSAETTMNSFFGGHNMSLGASIVLFPHHVNTEQKAKDYQRYVCNYLGHDINFTCHITANVYTNFHKSGTQQPTIHLVNIDSEGATNIALQQKKDCAEYFQQAFDAQIQKNRRNGTPIDYSVCIRNFPGAYGPNSEDRGDNKHYGFVLPWTQSTSKDYDLKSHGYVTIPLLEDKNSEINNSMFNLKQLMALRFGDDGKVRTNTSAKLAELSHNDRLEFLTKRQVYIDYAIIRLIAEHGKGDTVNKQLSAPIADKVLEILIATLVKIHALITCDTTLDGNIPLETTSDIYLLHDVLVSVQRLAYIAAVYGNPEYSFWDYLDYESHIMGHPAEASYLDQHMEGLVLYSQSQLLNQTQRNYVQRCYANMANIIRQGPSTADDVFTALYLSNKCLSYNDPSLFLQEVKYRTRTPEAYTLPATAQIRPSWIRADTGPSLTQANVITQGYIHPSDRQSCMSMTYLVHNDRGKILMQVPGTIKTEIMEDAT